MKVLRVVDGDTIDAQIDLGFKVHHNVRVRLYGINAPESRTRDLEEKARGKAASARVAELLDSADRIILKSHGVGKFGRCLGELTLIFFQDEEDRRENLVETMLAEGHGCAIFRW